ncbi:MAG: hypothetical protein DWP92_05610 [Armatimonadetes bacterium]|nr:MAG: hypothetical protein DWP92_05610 [Armatimonadota bacterium]
MRFHPGRSFLALVSALTITSACSSGPTLTYELHHELGVHFEAAGTEGAFVAKRIGTDDIPIVYNAVRAREPLPPAETFRPLATLVLLETETVGSLDEPLTWSGEGAYVQDWHRTHSLRTALTDDAEWVYQQTADEMGRDPYEVWINRLGYGNTNVRGGQGSFWMDGTLLIDMFQQTEFMALLASESQPFDRSAVRDIRNELATIAGDGWTMTYQEGRVPGSGTEDRVGWLVGIVEVGDVEWAIAMNMDVDWDRTIDPDARVNLTTTLLEAVGITSNG